MQRRLLGTQHVSQLALTQFAGRSSRLHAVSVAARIWKTVRKLVKQFQKLFLALCTGKALWDANSIDISFSEGSSSVLDSRFASRPQMKFSLLVSLIKLASKFRN